MSLAKSSIGAPAKVEIPALLARLERCLSDLDRLGENLAAAHLSACIDVLSATASPARGLTNSDGEAGETK